MSRAGFSRETPAHRDNGPALKKWFFRLARSFPSTPPERSAATVSPTYGQRIAQLRLTFFSPREVFSALLNVHPKAPVVVF